jgi:hypothetical protein
MREYKPMAFLSKIKNRDAVLKAIGRYDELGEEQFFKTYGFGRPKEYFIKYRGKLYPSKAIMGVAYGFEDPSDGPLKPGRFSGGRAAAAKCLVALNFDVVKVLRDGSEIPVNDSAEGTASESPELLEAIETVAVLAGRRSPRQGFAPSPAARKAIENRAMLMAIQKYERDGWTVDPSVARNKLL